MSEGAKPDNIVQRDDSMNSVLEFYRRSPIVRGLVQLVPYGGPALDAAIISAFDLMGQKRIDRFFRDLEENKLELTPDVVQSDEFLHRFMITSRAVMVQGEAEKIRLFANLLKRGTTSADLSTAEYEEFTQILEALSTRELHLLRLIDENQKSLPVERGKPAPASGEFWNRLIDEAANTLNVTSAEIGAMLVRLTRTGCYIENPSTSWQYGRQGYTTAIWRRFRKYVIDSATTQSEHLTRRNNE